MVLRRGAHWSGTASAEPTVSARPALLSGEDLPQEPRQKRSLDKRARLKEAGLALFGEKGYEGTSIEEIAQRANLAVGGFYQHFRSKRQLLLVLMDELLDRLSKIEFRPQAADGRSTVRALLAQAFERDLHYLGAYRAWQEAALSDPELSKRDSEIHAWTTLRVTAVFQRLQNLPGTRKRVDTTALARVMDGFFWSLLVRALHVQKVELNEWIETSTHLIYHAMFRDATPGGKR